MRLFIEISQGSESAFREAFQRYCPRMLHFAAKMLKSDFAAEEAVQEVFIRLWKHREVLSEIKNPNDYMFILIRNQVMNDLRSISREQKRREQLWEDMEQRAVPSSPSLSIEVRETEELLKNIMNQLTPQQRKIFHLSRGQGLSHQEIGDQLHISPLTAKKHIADSLKIIKSNLKKLN